MAEKSDGQQENADFHKLIRETLAQQEAIIDYLEQEPKTEQERDEREALIAELREFVPEIIKAHDACVSFLKKIRKLQAGTEAVSNPLLRSVR